MLKMLSCNLDVCFDCVQTARITCLPGEACLFSWLPGVNNNVYRSRLLLAHVSLWPDVGRGLQTPLCLWPCTYIHGTHTYTLTTSSSETAEHVLWSDVSW